MNINKFGITFFLLLFLLQIAFADTTEHSFSSGVTLTIDTGINNINILVEGNNNTYSITNSTNSYTINFKRNISCSNSTQQTVNNYYSSGGGDNISIAINQMSSSCQKIADAYSDTKSYYQPLLDCTTSKSQCEKEKDIYKQNSDKVVSLDSSYNNCLAEKKNFETQFNNCILIWVDNYNKLFIRLKGRIIWHRQKN